MYRFIHWYNQNKKNFWKIVGITVGILLIIQIVNKTISIKNKENSQNIVIGEQNQNTLNEIILEDNKSVLTGENISENQTDKLEILDKFVEFCNNNQIEEAYNLLSEECKKEMYDQIDDFQNNYYNKIFNGKRKNISVENWIGNIYKVKFLEDALSTGIYNKESGIQDYITIVEDNEDKIKLNINGYIGKEKMNQSKEAFDIKISILEKNQYMDFETYKFEVVNNSKNTVMLCEKEDNERDNTGSIYLEDNNGLKYYAYLHELSEADIRVLPGETKEIEIKYYNKYSSTKQIEKIVFSEIALGGNEYAKFEI